MNKTLISLITLIVLNGAFFKYSYGAFTHSELNYYLNVVRSAYANRFVEVSVPDIDIQPSVTNPDKLIITLLVIEKNTGETPVSPANYSLSTQDGVEGFRETFYSKSWKPLEIGVLGPGQQKEGALFFEIPKSDTYTFTYTRGYQSVHYHISSEKGLFIPFIINQLN